MLRHPDTDQLVYVLHTRLYCETSLLLETLTAEYGRVTVIAQGARKNARGRGLLQPFIPLLMAFSRRGDRFILVDFEEVGHPCVLRGTALIHGLYMNELIIRLLHRWDPHPEIFDAYEHGLRALSIGQSQESVLWIFQKKLLSALGYGLPLLKEAGTGHAVVSGAWYHYDPVIGPKRIHEETQEYDMTAERPQALFSGESLLALEYERFENAAVLPEVKRLMRKVFVSHLGNRPLEAEYWLKPV